MIEIFKPVLIGFYENISKKRRRTLVCRSARPRPTIGRLTPYDLTLKAVASLHWIVSVRL
jgi:hypothetical protein